MALDGAASVANADAPPQAGQARPRLCQECGGPLHGVAVGPCGHQDVCDVCSIMARYFGGSRRCPSCRAKCPTVLMTSAFEWSERGAVLRWARPPAPREGRDGYYYWYHKSSRSYFDDEEHYRVAKSACAGAEEPSKYSCTIM